MKKEWLPEYERMHDWELYGSNLQTEYRQSLEEGLDVENYKEVMEAVSNLPKGALKEEMGDALFSALQNAKKREDYPYQEPSTLKEIFALRRPYPIKEKFLDRDGLFEHLKGAWMGRICGCLLGKTVEGIKTDELVPFLKATDNFPMHRYILKTDLDKVDVKNYRYPFATRDYADNVDGMPADDDTNYLVLAQEVVARYGRDFTSFNMAQAWLDKQPKNAYCTAERVAYCNFIKGFMPPDSALYKNPFREWIGAQIRGDYFGYINPGKPEEAADMAFRDASISHIKNGIYGEMWVAAMLAVAAYTDDFESILRGGLAQIPYTSRLYEAISEILKVYKEGMSQKDCFALIHQKWDEYLPHDWCHTISNAMIVAASLLYGQGDYGKSVCMAVEAGFDTDCNGATVGSIIGMARGLYAIDEKWTSPIRDTLHTAIFDVNTVNITSRVEETLSHL